VVHSVIVSHLEEKIHHYDFQATCVRNAVKRGYYHTLLVVVKKPGKTLYDGPREGLG
jgi:hypothetical protein